MNQEKAKPSVGGCIILVVVAVILFALVKSCFASTPEDDLKNNQIKALVYSHRCVEQQLKSPSTAEFPSSTEHVTMVNDSTFVVNSYVDSQNSFGAMIRTNYSCQVTLVGDDQYLCDNVVFAE